MYRKLLIYFKMLTKGMIHRPTWSTLSGAFKYFTEWWSSLAPGKNSISDGMPWMTFGAVDFVKKLLKPQMMVFEYGSGGSTLFWSSRLNRVISVEHERMWFEKMTSEFAERKVTNVQYVLAEPKDDTRALNQSFENPGDYVSSDPQYAGKSFESYVKEIERFPDGSFDIIVVDGRARPSCILHSMNKLKNGGYLIIDNSERYYYLLPFTFALSKWKVWKFYGAVPYDYNFSETAIFQKPML